MKIKYLVLVVCLILFATSVFAAPKLKQKQIPLNQLSECLENNDCKLLKNMQSIPSSEITCTDSDFDNSFKVDLIDFAFFASHYLDEGCITPNWCEGTDLNQDGVVNLIDFAQFASHYHQYCKLEVHYIDVEQGDSIFIISPDNYTLLIDAGYDQYGNGVVNYIRNLGYDKIDYVMASHLHADHLGGLDKVVNSLNPDVCYDHGGTYTTTQYNQYNTACSGKRQTLTQNDYIDLGPQVTAKVLQAGYGSDENFKSIVLRLTYDDKNFLFGGDCEQPCEATFNPGPIDVYKVHHHGSSDSSSWTFLTQMQPDVCYIPLGADNPYGYPHEATMTRLNNIGCTVYRADLDNNVLLESNGKEYTVYH